MQGFCVSVVVSVNLPSGERVLPLIGPGRSRSGSFTLSKIECSKQASFAVNTLAWNNEIGLSSYFVGFRGKSND